MHTLSRRTHSPAFSQVASSPLSVSRWRRRERRNLHLRRHCRLHCFFTPTGSPFPPASPNKLAVGVTGHSPEKQSVSLGRATAVGVDGSPGLGEGKGVGGSESGGGGGANGIGGESGNVPRQNSLGDLKIPARISQAQVTT